MGILKWIGNAIVGVFVNIGDRILESFGFVRKAKKAAKAATVKEAVNARIRREWLEVGDARQLKEDGIEYEGEIYYETIH